MLDALWQDLRYAARALRGSPGFAAVAILSLALGIGANTAIFSLIDAVMLRSFPVSHPEELLQVTLSGGVAFANPAWEQIRDRQDVFSGIFGYGRWALNLARGGERRDANTYFVSGQFFDTLRVLPLLGRTLTPADDVRGCAGTAVLSYGFWQREFGGDGSVVGKTISLENQPFQIVGVTGQGFTGFDVGYSADVMIPFCSEKIVHGETSNLDSRNAIYIRIIGRPKPGISASQATARLKTLGPAILESAGPEQWFLDAYFPHFQRTLDTEPVSKGVSFVRDQYRQALIILMAIAGVVLLIACANVANLLLARGAARQREIAIRMALGSGAGRLIRQLLTESLLLASIGAGLGIALARAGTSALIRYMDVPLDLTPDARVLGFTAGVAVLTALLFGIAPAWRGTRVQPQAAMKSGARGVISPSGTTGKFELGKILVMAQVALSLLLVAGAGLLLSTFWKLAWLDAGIESDRVLQTNIDTHNANYDPERRRAALAEMLENLRAIPGAGSASISDIQPLCGCLNRNELVIEGNHPVSPQDSMVVMNRVSERYFETLGIPIVAGRDFDAHDTPQSPPAALINQTGARKYFGTDIPLGRVFRARRDGKLGPPIEIVGVVKDSKYGGLRESTQPAIYYAWRQTPTPNPQTYFEVRAAVPAAMIAGVKSAIGEVNPSVSLQFATLSARIGESISRERLLAALSGLFGAIALLLATVGLYGVMSYNVTRRRNEIGIRMALGAEQARVLRMVLGETALLIGIGLMAGLGAAVATTRFVASFLYGVTPNDPLTLFLAAAVLAGVAFAAGYGPARRASRQDPMAALREE